MYDTTLLVMAGETWDKANMVTHENVFTAYCGHNWISVRYGHKECSTHMQW